MHHRLLLPVFTLTIFGAASLLFAVQPLVARMLLPKLGGTPVVWNTAQVFFQSVLLLGYLYAHVLQRHLSLKRQVVVHGAVMALALVFLPLAFRGAPPEGDLAVAWLIGTLFATAGMPFFVISASSPLFQSWFSRTTHPEAEDPYHLYAASNAGSMFTLLSYPFLIEPSMRLATQSWTWALGFVGLLGMSMGAGWLATRSARAPEAHAEETGSDGAPGARQIGWWMLCSFIPSSLILSVTTYLTTDISSIPLLWVLPLSLYLLSFIIVFARRRPVPHWFWVALLPGLLVPMLATLVYELRLLMWAALLVHLLLFFVITLVFHGELVRTRPAAKHLTGFYLWMSFGGVLGGAFTALLAPLLFVHQWEYPLLLVLAALALPAIRGQGKASKVIAVVMACISMGLLIWAMAGAHGLYKRPLPLYIAPGILIAVGLLLAPRWPRIFGGLAVVLVGAGLVYEANAYRTIHAARSYFGIHYVREREQGAYYQLTHGRIMHGLQWRDEERRKIPVSYYHYEGPLGRMIGALEKRDGGLKRAAVVGLGTGSIAAYAKPSQTYDFYEIDPTVVEIARNPKYFTYMSDCRGTCNVVLGDGRLKLAEAKDGAYDLIVLDAYSSDAIPVHMITREALAIFLGKLAPGGVVAFHVSNKYLRLHEIVSALAKDATVSAYLADHGPTKELKALKVNTSTWVFLARAPEDMGALLQDPLFKPTPDPKPEHVWTDDFANILQIYEWK